MANGPPPLVSRHRCWTTGSTGRFVQRRFDPRSGLAAWGLVWTGGWGLGVVELWNDAVLVRCSGGHPGAPWSYSQGWKRVAKATVQAGPVNG